MEWPTIAQISTLAPLPDGYHYEKLSRRTCRRSSRHPALASRHCRGRR